VRRMTSRAYLTFVSIDRSGQRVKIPGLILSSESEKRCAAEAELRRAERLKARKSLNEVLGT
jgi:acyl-CoA hydrolase